MHTNFTQKTFGEKLYFIMNEFKMLLKLDFGGKF